jgi:hypothetical protein
LITGILKLILEHFAFLAFHPYLAAVSFHNAFLLSFTAGVNTSKSVIKPPAFPHHTRVTPLLVVFYPG